MGSERVKTFFFTSVTLLLRSIREILSEMPLTKKMTTKSLEPPFLSCVAKVQFVCP